MKCRPQLQRSAQCAPAIEAIVLRRAFLVHHGLVYNIIYGKPADYQCDGFNSTLMVHNTIIAENLGQVVYGCVGKAFGAQGSYNSVHQNYNSYYGAGLSACGHTFEQLQAAGYDTDSTLSPNITVQEILALARKMLIQK
jgi:hypothetical protein